MKTATPHLALVLGAVSLLCSSSLPTAFGQYTIDDCPETEHLLCFDAEGIDEMESCLPEFDTVLHRAMEDCLLIHALRRDILKVHLTAPRRWSPYGGGGSVRRKLGKWRKKNNKKKGGKCRVGKCGRTELTNRRRLSAGEDAGEEDGSDGGIDTGLLLRGGGNAAASSQSPPSRELLLRPMEKISDYDLTAICIATVMNFWAFPVPKCSWRGTRFTSPSLTDCTVEEATAGSAAGTTSVP